MNDKEYKQKLSQVADWHIPTDAEKPYAKPKRRKKNEDIVELVGEDYHEEITGPNPTLAPAITRLKVQGCQCDDCGKWCEEGRKKEKKLYKTGKNHWREHCLTCNKWKDPVTGDYTLSNIQVSQFFSNMYRENKGINNSKHSKAREIVLHHEDKTTIETERETITFYHEKNTSA